MRNVKKLFCIVIIFKTVLLGCVWGCFWAQYGGLFLTFHAIGDVSSVFGFGFHIEPLCLAQSSCILQLFK